MQAGAKVKEVPKDILAGIKKNSETRLSELKLANLLRTQTKEFSRETYTEELPITVVDQKGNVTERKWHPENVIRWRYSKTEDEEPDDYDKELEQNLDIKCRKRRKIETNTKVVEWSDGSVQMIVGDEVFDLTTNEMAHTYLFRKYEDLLVCKDEVIEKTILIPTALTSKSHQEILKRVTNSSKNVEKIKTTFSGLDHDKRENQDIKFTTHHEALVMKPPISETEEHRRFLEDDEEEEDEDFREEDEDNNE